jgi:hypothetical protein
MSTAGHATGFQETVLKTIERVMRVMTHVNIGATLGMAAWLAWSGLQHVSGQGKVATPALPGIGVRLPAFARPLNLPCCFAPAEQRRQPSLQVQSMPAPRIAAAAAAGAVA